MSNSRTRFIALSPQRPRDALPPVESPGVYRTLQAPLAVFLVVLALGISYLADRPIPSLVESPPMAECTAFDQLREGLTGTIRIWLQGLNTEGSRLGEYLLPRYAVAEAKETARLADDADEAAARLKDWFIDRLTIDPGHPGAFSDLAFNLLTQCLDLVDWSQLAEEVRTGAY